MKKGDVLWIVALGAFLGFIILPGTHEIFISVTKNYPLLGGFIKFAYLATLGELLAIRIVTGDWKKPPAILWRATIWGFLGAIITVIFQVYAGGVTSALEVGMLPGKGMTIAFAFFTSALMNGFFAPTFMAFHRCTDTYLDMKCGEGISNPSLKAVIERIDWHGFISFVVLKTIPFFWIPAHTITFLLPAEYRILVAALLSIALGGILAFAKKKK